MSWTDESRQRWIQERQKTSLFWQMIHLFGSLRLAMLLLFTIALACAIATVCESTFNAKVAQAYIYKAPWFILWLGLLCLNLACAALSRFPWQKKHVGFVTTHAGIIIVLIGALVGQRFGFEAGVTLHKDRPPTNRLVMNQHILQVDSPRDRATYIMPIDVEIAPPSQERPKKLPLPHSDVRLLIDRFSENLALVPAVVPAAGGSAGIELKFTSSMMSQSIPVALVREPASASSNDFFGQARIELLDQLPESNSAPAKTKIEETQVVLAEHKPVIHSSSAASSGYDFALRLVNGEPRLFVQSSAGEGKVIDVISHLRQPITIDEMQLTIRDYWPDFSMQNGQPVSLSQQPRNPAVLVTLSGEVTPKGKPLLQLAMNDASTVAYQVSRDGEITTRGAAKIGEKFAPGWADWRARVMKVLPSALIQTRFLPGGTGEELPGIRAQLVTPAGKKGAAAWIPAGRTEMLRADEHFARIGFGLQTRTLNFLIGLEKFEVPRDEGTETPADFISSVYFRDGERVHRATIHMNRPATYPPDLWHAFTGTGYKFSQASWNPQDLDETTLQVLHDPGWLLKWVGSLLVCTGIGIMFYWKPRSAVAPPKKREPEMELAQL